MLADIFPRYAQLAPEEPVWTRGFDWGAGFRLDALQALWTLQVAAMGDRPRFWALTEAMIADLASARVIAADDVAIDTIDASRFVTCMPALHLARVAGQIGDCFDWIWTAVSPTHDRSERVNENVIRFIALNDAPEALMNIYFGELSKFSAATFYVAYRLGGLDGLTEMIVQGAWRVALHHHRSIPADTAAIEALLQMAIWAAHKDNQWARPFAVTLRQMLSTEPVPGIRKQLMMAFLTPVHRFTDRSPQDWADQLLDEHDEDFVEHERLQVLATSLRGPDTWRDRKAEVLAAIEALRVSYLALSTEGTSDLEVLELRVGILNPLIYCLANWSLAQDIVDVLGAWYRAPGCPAADADVLVIIPTHNGGAGYVWPQGHLLTGQGNTTTHDAMQHAASAALGAYHRGQDGDHDPERYLNMRFDVIHPQAGYAFEAAMAAHYQVDLLTPRIPDHWRPRSLVVFPSGPEPIQAFLAKHADIAAPVEVSFQAPAPTRPIRCISVWAAGVLHEEFEVGAIAHVAERQGWRLVVHRHEAPTAEQFKAFYEDEAADVLWVISHGAHDPFRVTGTGIHIDQDQLLGLEWVSSLGTPQLGRRLLVLNSCSGAASQVRGGTSRIGLAQSLTEAHQLVVGNLWPIHWSVALAFGAIFVAELAAKSPVEGYFAAIEAMRTPAELMAQLSEVYGPQSDLIQRLERAGEDFESLMTWGCPLLLT